MRDHKSSVVVTLLLLLIVASIGLIANTFAKYTEQFNATASTSVAEWSFNEDNQKSTYTFNITSTVEDDTLVDGKIAPGTSGKVDIKLVNTHTDVAVDYTVTLGVPTNAPTNMLFYTDSTFTTALAKDGTGTITGTLTPNDSTGVTKTIYWKWAYETASAATNDLTDTNDGKLANDVTIPVTVVGVQHNPEVAI